MNRLRRLESSGITLLALACVFGVVLSAAADGMVVPEEFFPKVEIPNQQALIQFSNGVERLVIETAFFGEGTNFAWVVPLPSEPEVRPVSEHFFEELQRAFTPRLVHKVMPWYATVLFFCGLLLLGSRAIKDEVSWVSDIPLCLLLAVMQGFLGRHYGFGILAAALILYLRIFARTPATLAAGLMVGLALSIALTVIPRSHGFGLVQTLGPELGEETVVPGVTVLSVQHAGVFDSTTIRGDNPAAVSDWLTENGYRLPVTAAEALRYYHARGWVFVASRVRRAAQSNATTLHPLLFTFKAAEPIYPTRLTAVENQVCAMDLYDFADHKAKARHFDVVRCERVDLHAGKSHLQFEKPELISVIGEAKIGTKLSARLTPAQMAHEDVAIKRTVYWGSGAVVFSRVGALNIALNTALPLGALVWLLLGASRGGWEVDEKWVRRWRRRSMAMMFLGGISIFLLLPKTDVVTRPAVDPQAWVDRTE